MSRSLATPTARLAGLRAPDGLARALVQAALALSVALAAAIAVLWATMAPPASEIVKLSAYMSVSGIVTMAAGWAVLRAADGAAGLDLRAKSFAAAAMTGGVALLNVVIIARLMFVSTSHDLPLLAGTIAFSVVVGAFFAHQLAGATARRLDAVAITIRRLAEGEHAARVAAGGRDEVGRLAADVNLLAARLKQADADRHALDAERRDLTAAISHDLRTPLASMRAMVEALDDGVVTGAESARYYRTMRREIDRLSRMIDDLFELARLDAGALQLDRHPVSLQEIAAEVVDAMQAQAQQLGIALAVQAEPALDPIPLDGSRVERALANLVKNALEHTPSGGRVDVRIRRDGDLAVLAVADTGEGIVGGDVERVWDRFYRGEKSRSRAAENSDGAGLGLAIVQGIVRAHGGITRVHSTAGHGSIFEIAFPA